jgi:hypothetical protein
MKAEMAELKKQMAALTVKTPAPSVAKAVAKE